jgi:hypothetical protein
VETEKAVRVAGDRLDQFGRVSSVVVLPCPAFTQVLWLNSTSLCKRRTAENCTCYSNGNISKDDVLAVFVQHKMGQTVRVVNLVGI